MVTKIIRSAFLAFLISGLVQLNSCVPLGTLPTSDSGTNQVINRPPKTIQYSDNNYETYVGNVILNSTNPFTPLGNSEPLHLEFDLLTSKFENLQARYIHCNYDWKPSQLQEIQYLNAFNRFDHESFEYSMDKSAYVTYTFKLARPSISGNYLVVLYRRDNSNDILFTRRIVFYESKVNLSAKLRVPQNVSQRRTHQQLDFELDYGGLQVPNPEQNIKTRVLLNRDWSKGLDNLKPTTVFTPDNKMEWKYNFGETTFPGWNQFRWLDLRTLVVRGQNITKIVTNEKSFDAYQGIDSDHGSDSYRQLIEDRNGGYLPWNGDPGQSWSEADYANVHFTLKSVRNVGDVYVMGRFNDWRKDETNRMDYVAEVGVYEKTIRLKQGLYDYRYEVESKNFDPYLFEGSHFQTENEYNILVYYRAPGKINDQVVGYWNINSAGFY